MKMKGGDMTKLNEIELSNIDGGSSVGTTIGISMIITAVLSFISGIINGYTNPEECRVKGN
jgi:hypothetical protein